MTYELSLKNTNDYKRCISLSARFSTLKNFLYLPRINVYVLALSHIIIPYIVVLLVWLFIMHFNNELLHIKRLFHLQFKFNVYISVKFFRTVWVFLLLFILIWQFSKQLRFKVITAIMGKITNFLHYANAFQFYDKISERAVQEKGEGKFVLLNNKI